MEKQKRIKVFLMEVDNKGVAHQGYITEIDNTLKAFQSIVKGSIESCRLTKDIDVTWNAVGKYDPNCPLNRAWLNEKGEVIELIFGNIVCSRHTGDEFSDIYEEDIETILRTYKAAVPLGNGFLIFEEKDLPKK